MLGDALYKLARKLLPISFYRSLSRSVLGREKRWKRIETYVATFEFYRGQGMDFAGRKVAEVGSGDQYYTALFFLSAGAEQVLLVEPTLAPDAEKLAAELQRFNEHTSTGLRLEDVKGRILCFRDLSEINPSLESQVDFFFSYLVLEHFRDIESFFLHTKRVLKTSGISCNLVDLSDHTYHLLVKYRFLRPFAERRLLYHLRYSDRMFDLVNDPKCYMNRKLLPEYLGLASKYNLRIAQLSKKTDEGAVVHPDLLRRYSSADPNDLKVVNFFLGLEKTE